MAAMPITTRKMPTAIPTIAPVDSAQAPLSDPAAPAAEPESVEPTPPTGTPTPSCADIVGKAA